MRAGSVGLALRRFRGWAVMTQEQFAAAMTHSGCPMHRATVAKIEAGTRKLTFDEAVAACRVLDISLAQLEDTADEGDAA